MSSAIPFDYQQLTIAQRLELVEEIWDSIRADADAATLPLSGEERAMLDDRLADLEARPHAGAPWSEVRARILGRAR